MTVEARLRKLEKTVDLVADEILRAVSLLQLYRRCAVRTDIVDAVNSVRLGLPFEVVRQSLHFHLVMVLMRIHEDDGRGKVASLPTIARILDDPTVCRELERRAFERGLHAREIPLEPELAVATKADDAKRGEAAKQLVAKRLRSARHRTARLQAEQIYEALRKLRDRTLAHSDLRDRTHGAKYGYERRLLQRTIPIVHSLQMATTGVNWGFDRQRSFWNTTADRFWKFAISNPSTKRQPRRFKGRGRVGS